MSVLSIVYQDGSEVPGSDMNAIVGAINGNYDQIVLTKADVQFLLDINNSFKVIHVGGLSGKVLPGIFKNLSGSLVSIPETPITFSTNSTIWVSISDSGVITQGTSRPSTGMEIARIVTNATVVTEVIDLRTRFSPISTFATLADIVAATPERLVSARKTTATGYLPFSTYLIVDAWNIVDKNLGNIFNPTTGIITIPTTNTYKISARLRLISDYTDEPVAAKLSIFSGSSEMVVIDEKGTPQGGLVLQGDWEPDSGLSLGNQISLRVYLTAGVNVKISGSNTNTLEVTRKPFR